MAVSKKTFLEKAGFGLTSLCAIHCIATPFLLTVTPILGSKFQAFHQYEFLFLIGSLILAFYLMYKDYLLHKNPLPMQLIGLAFIIATVGWQLLAEIIVSVLVSVLVLSAYWFNWKHKEKCKCKLSQS